MARRAERSCSNDSTDSTDSCNMANQYQTALRTAPSCQRRGGPGHWPGRRPSHWPPLQRLFRSASRNKAARHIYLRPPLDFRNRSRRRDCAARPHQYQYMLKIDSTAKLQGRQKTDFANKVSYSHYSLSIKMGSQKLRMFWRPATVSAPMRTRRIWPLTGRGR